MIITCEECRTSFNLDEKLLRPTGSKVRCSKCGDVFITFPPPPEAAAPAAAAPVAPAVPQPPAQERVESTAADDVDTSAIAETDEIDLGLDLESEGEDPATAAAEEPELPEDDLDFSDLDLGLDQEEEAAAPEAEAPVDDELDLSDLDLDPGLEETAAAPETEAPADDELDLSDLDLGADFEDEPVAPEPESVAPAGEDELDLGDLDLGADFEDEPAAPEPAAPDPEDELNLSDLDLDLGLDGEAAAPEEALADGGDLDLDDLDLDALEAEEEPIDDSDDLSLGEDLEEAPVAPEEGLDLDDLELDEISGAPAAEEALDDLDLDLEAEDDLLPETGSTLQSEDTSDELDISELEAVFDAPDDEADVADSEVEEYDLEFDMDLLDGSDAAEPEDVVLDDSSDELDLGDVETLLDGSDEEPAPKAGEMDALDGEMDLDLDLEELEPDAAGGAAMEGEGRLPGAEAAEDGEALSFAESMDMETLEKESMALEDAGPDAGAAPAMVAPRPRRRSSIGKPVKFLLILFLLLAVVGGGLYYATTFMGIQIPYVSDFLNPQPDNVNRIEIIQGTVRSKFVENSKAGKLFVITGRAINNYKKPHNFISIKGKLYGKGKKLIATQTVFAGNMLTATEQATLDLPSINKRLRNRVGEKKTNMNVKPGSGVPFMVVFANLPSQLEEFTVEPGSSVSAQ
ncbi:hypothetical protein D3OALGA1CA_3497 [Olavius algarvensis associated proteobacterium Delta 3]|nr:hypothetical protein D3OALGB2SA_3805 [Olavius algarvensis associated proteobacterium Delta 3]CAB5135317.1 hypothetical protein D3OALGA1CA_3497 [Olavius algarvensis associated proteobacterium Delta 3]